ncbi:hypothetical protein BDN67DRAFT_953305 [Paxillus ammoniavirescens]|nr:hypothetical protein BDN67DRAFT_953305 [Paxillus ammoniavirescens]
MQPFSPNLRLVDSHSTPDTKNCSAFTYQVKPDLCVYSNRSSKGCDSSEVEMTIEFKWDPGQNPFGLPYVDDDRPKFIVDRNAARDTLGQITAYASAQLGSQFRTHCFSVLVVREIAYIIRWDREGAVVSTPIRYGEDKTLAEFFSRYSQASPELRGVDTTVSQATTQEAKLASEELELPAGTRMLKTTLPVNANDSLLLIFPAPTPPGYPPVGRATRACAAYEWHSKRVVFLKDSWRVLLDGVLSEGDTYMRLNSAGVHNVPTCLAFRDVECIPEQRPQTVRLSKEGWSCTPPNLVPHAHHRFVLNIAGSPLTSFSSTRELVTAIRDGLIAHEDALHKAGILHRDISLGNIIIHFGKGLLIDWDLAKLVTTSGRRQTTRTGTWQFMSVTLLCNPNAAHTFVDDLESSFWVLLWTSLMTIQSSLSLEERSSRINLVFNDVMEAGAGKQKKLLLLVPDDELSPSAKPLFPKHPGLCQLLLRQAEIFRSRYIKPPQNESIIIEHLKSGPDPETYIALTQTSRLHQMQLELASHQALIATYDECLRHNWPYDAPAEPQLIKPPRPYGEESQPHIMSKSFHGMVRVELKNSKRRKVDPSSGASTSGSSGYSTEPIKTLVEQEGSNATIRGTSLSFSRTTSSPDVFM